MTRPEVEGAGARILIVEDESLIAEEIKERLTHLGFQIAGLADTAEMALRMAEIERPDLVLMDIRLKGVMDGIETAAQLRRSLDIPVVYLTAHSDHATLKRAQETEPLAYVIKPFRESELSIAIEIALRRHRVERSLQESALRYAATLASIGDGVLATDPESRVTFLNPVAEALTGWTLAEARGLAVEEVLTLVGEADRSTLESPTRRALRLQAVVGLDQPTLLLTRQGEAIPIDDSAAPITTRTGEIIGAVLAFRDDRIRRLAEDALWKAKDQVLQTQKMEAIGRLAGGVAHDFNSLLTVIIGFSELLLENEGLDPGSVGPVREIQKAAERAATLTRQLLAFSRKQLLVPVPLDLDALIANGEPLLRRLLGDEIVLTTSLRAPARVNADPGQLEQIILDLATNAREAMPNGGRLTLETSCVDFDAASTATRPEIKPGRYVVLALSDTGTGMDEATRANLFEPFFTSKEFGQGSGLGLASAYGIVKQSDGHLEVESAPGRGTTFKIFLPALPEPPQPPHST